MEFKMIKDLSFHFTLSEKELTTFYKLIQKLDFGYGLVINEFEITEDERDLIDWLDKDITHSGAYDELKLGED